MAIKKVKKNDDAEIRNGFKVLSGPGFWGRYSGVVFGLMVVLIAGVVIYSRQDAGLNLANVASWFRPNATSTSLLVSGEANKKSQDITPSQSAIDYHLQEEPNSQRLVDNNQSLLQIPSPKGGAPLEEVFTAKAEKGQGKTHLARKALQMYLEKEKPNISLSKEHKIYIEDYLKDSVQKIRIYRDDQISFSPDLIQKAISASQKLSANQLHGLTKYVSKVPSLQDYTPLAQ